MKIEILDDAEQDIENSIYFYEAQKQGLGRYFLDTILADIDSLIIYAGIHIKIKGYYRHLSKRFPFAVYYKILDETIKIYAVLDCRKNPSSIEKRLK